MSPPLIPEGHGRASPQPRRFDKTNVHDWITVLHNAAKVPAGHADYEDARDVTQQALEQIGHLQRQAGAQDRIDQNFEPVNPVVSGLAGAAQGASLGIGEPIAGAIDAATGGSFGAGAQRYREGLERVAESNPATFALSEFGGQVAPMLTPIRSAIGTVQARVPLTAGEKLLRIARGGAAGATVGGVAGFSAGGEDPGDFSQRFDQAKISAEIGALLGATATGVGLRGARADVEQGANMARQGVEDAQAQVNLDASRLRLQRLQQRADAGDAAPTTELPIHAPEPPAPSRTVPPEVVAAVRDYEAGKISGADLRMRMDAAQGRTAPVEALRRDVGAQLGGQPIELPVSRETISPSTLVDQLPPEMQTSRGGPGRVVPDRADMLSPSDLVDRLPPEMQTSRGTAPQVGERRFGAKVVPAGPYQKAAPATRMQSPSQGSLISEAIKQSGRHPELLGPIPTEILQSQYEFAQSLGGADPAVLKAVGQELMRRMLAP